MLVVLLAEHITSVQQWEAKPPKQVLCVRPGPQNSSHCEKQCIRHYAFEFLESIALPGEPSPVFTDGSVHFQTDTQCFALLTIHGTAKYKRQQSVERDHPATEMLTPFHSTLVQIY